ncbi:MAG: sulfite exporter TauE/SafE family protein [Clostridiales bacterium]|jgi:uncharacterized membrane protein YfcA|nr:sulfite exporter TauE/SafE family protein [Clostridiales bacterium]
MSVGIGEISLYVLIGLASGIISGMGIGGGSILIPALCVFFSMDQHLAQNINLLYFLPTAAIALITHAKQGNIEKKPLMPIILFGFLGAVAGSIVAVKMDSSLLRRCFGFFLLAMGIYELFRKPIERGKVHDAVR